LFFISIGGKAKSVRHLSAGTPLPGTGGWAPNSRGVARRAEVKRV
jgi:hypothetical protein